MPIRATIAGDSMKTRDIDSKLGPISPALRITNWAGSRAAHSASAMKNGPYEDNDDSNISNLSLRDDILLNACAGALDLITTMVISFRMPRTQPEPSFGGLACPGDEPSFVLSPRLSCSRFRRPTGAVWGRFAGLARFAHRRRVLSQSWKRRHHFLAAGDNSILHRIPPVPILLHTRACA